jgi:hypothetical protein
MCWLISQTNLEDATATGDEVGDSTRWTVEARPTEQELKVFSSPSEQSVTVVKNNLINRQ